MAARHRDAAASPSAISSGRDSGVVLAAEIAFARRGRGHDTVTGGDPSPRGRAQALSKTHARRPRAPAGRAETKMRSSSEGERIDAAFPQWIDSMKPIASNVRIQILGPHPEEAALFARPSRRMAAGMISLVAVLRDARKSALLRTRLIDDIEMIRTKETLYQGEIEYPII
jgi:hypothetical protein